METHTQGKDWSAEGERAAEGDEALHQQPQVSEALSRRPPDSSAWRRCDACSLCVDLFSTGGNMMSLRSRIRALWRVQHDETEKLAPVPPAASRACYFGALLASPWLRCFRLLRYPSAGLPNAPAVFSLA